jgi:antitoxin component of MazEF toxin-antitoxin module
MIQKLRRAGHSYVVTIPRKEVERRGLHAGQDVEIETFAVERRRILPPDVVAAFDVSWAQNEEAYRYLGEH